MSETYVVPVLWTCAGTIEVEAETPLEAANLALVQGNPSIVSTSELTVDWSKMKIEVKDKPWKSSLDGIPFSYCPTTKRYFSDLMEEPTTDYQELKKKVKEHNKAIEKAKKLKAQEEIPLEELAEEPALEETMEETPVEPPKKAKQTKPKSEV